MEEKCHPLLRPLINIVEMIGAALGPDYEVLLHDVSSGEPLTLAAANSRLSGRDSNSPMSDFGRFLMESLEAKKVDYIANYPSEAANGRQMRSSVSLIRDEEGGLVGFLCVNYDMSRAKMLKDISDFLTKTHPIELGGMRVEKFTKAAGEEDLLEKARKKMGRPLEYLSSSERRECIRYLDEIGFFQLKGSVETLAKAVNKSRYTLYADLREVRKG